MQEDFFAVPSVASAYAVGRPYFHPLVIARLRELIPTPTFTVDIGCGTGLSTRALSEISAKPIGLDPSLSMLSQAPRGAKLAFAAATAEALPLREEAVALVTVASAFHWFDRARFLSEARRVLEPRGWLCIYDNWFAGRLLKVAAFTAWWREVYLARFPSPPRDRRPFTRQDALGFGLELDHESTFDNRVEMTLDELVTYWSTQTNAIAAIEEGRISRREWRDWVTGSVRQFLGERTGVFLFTTKLSVYRKAMGG